MKIIWEEVDSGEKGETDDFYWFEERGIQEVDNDGIGYGHFGDNYKIKIVES
jgi:hypothetical protein